MKTLLFSALLLTVMIFSFCSEQEVLNPSTVDYENPVPSFSYSQDLSPDSMLMYMDTASYVACASGGKEYPMHIFTGSWYEDPERKVYCLEDKNSICEVAWGPMPTPSIQSSFAGLGSYGYDTSLTNYPDFIIGYSPSEPTLTQGAISNIVLDENDSFVSLDFEDVDGNVYTLPR
jgi:hypothetical protein